MFPNLDPARAVLAKIGAEMRLAKEPTPEAILEVARDADAVLTTYAKVTAEMIPQMTRCRVIGALRHRRGQCRHSGGHARRALSSPGCRIIAWTKCPITPWRCCWRWCARFRRPMRARRPGDWEMRAVVPIHRLRGTVLGLVAFGQIPQLVAPKAQAFGIRVVTYDPYVSKQVAERAGVEQVEFDELLKISDYISIHTPLLPATHHLFNADVFRRMKPTAYLINTARGPDHR